jgi:hypothetical protein
MAKLCSLAYIWIMLSFSVSPAHRLPIILQGSGEGGYRGGLRLTLDPLLGLCDERGGFGNQLNDKALHNLLHSGIGDKNNCYYVRIYIPFEDETSGSMVVSTIERINRCHDQQKKTVVVLYCDSLRGKAWRITPWLSLLSSP